MKRNQAWILFFILSIVLLLAAPCSYGQHLLQKPATGTVIIIEKVNNLAGVTQQDLFKRAELWASHAFNTTSAVDLGDKDNGTIIIKSGFRYNYESYYFEKKKEQSNPATGTAYFTLRLYFKDGKYKFVLTDIATNTYIIASMRDDIDAGYLDKISLLSSSKSTDDKMLSKTLQSQVLSVDQKLVEILQSFTEAIAKKAESDF